MGLRTPRLWSFNEKHILLIGGVEGVGAGTGGQIAWLISLKANGLQNQWWYVNRSTLIDCHLLPVAGKFNNNN